MAPRCFIPTDQTGLLGWEVIINGQDMLTASLQPAAQNREGSANVVRTSCGEHGHGKPRTAGMDQPSAEQREGEQQLSQAWP